MKMSILTKFHVILCNIIESEYNFELRSTICAGSFFQLYFTVFVISVSANISLLGFMCIRAAESNLIISTTLIVYVYVVREPLDH